MAGFPGKPRCVRVAKDVAANCHRRAVGGESRETPETDVVFDDEPVEKALEGKNVDGGTVQIMSMQEKRPGKRRVNEEDIQREMDGASTPKSSSKKQKKGKKSSSKKKKQRAE